VVQSFVIKAERHPMTADKVKRMKALCQQIATEEDHEKFSQLIEELNELLERRTGGLTS
jgi:hypothetical protein